MVKKSKEIIKLLPFYDVLKSFYDEIPTPARLRRNKHLMAFYSQFINKGEICFDVGANLGRKTDIFLSLGASVVAVEPQGRCMKILKRKYAGNGKVILVPKALGEQEGENDLYVANAHTISSMSKKWILSSNSTGRFRGCQWNDVERVPVITLDMLIEKYGKPVFCKIDVEGYEYFVIKGLTQCIKYISFEFTPEFYDEIFDCIKYLTHLGNYHFNYSLGESTFLGLDDWVGPEKIFNELLSLANGDPLIWGDIYAKMIG